LSIAQTRGALDFLAREFPGSSFRLNAVETPGDRDLATPIDKAPADFFTRDLDDAVRSGRVDFAVHSAKDLPQEMTEGLDWFWLPCAGDRRDAWVVRKDDGRMRRLLESTPAARRRAKVRVGASGERRRAYAESVFPNAETPPVRGAIDSRVEQLLEGRFDAVLMACAGIERLWPDGAPGVDVVPIPVDELEPPEAQGVLAIVFRAGDERLTTMRERFVKAVRFVSAGVGDAGLCTLAGIRDIAAADVVLYDALFDADLISSPTLGLSMPRGSCRPRFVFVGKRYGAHSMGQAEITRLICDEARKGRRVVRLKGGDAGLFGRLAEETDALAELKIPFVVRPGVSALTAATTGTGMLLTRRGESRGFTAYTPRSTGTETPVVAFMATKIVRSEAKRLMAEGWPRGTPCAIVRDAGGPREEVRSATLAAAARGAFAADDPRPGLFIVGSPAARLWPKLGELAGARVLVTCSDAVWERARLAVEDRGGRPLRWPLIELKTRGGISAGRYDAVVLTSPAAARIFFDSCLDDVRRLPKFFTCGSGTDAELRAHGVSSDLMPPSDFSAAGLVREIAKLDLSGRRVLRLRSAKAGGAVARALRKAGAKVDDVVLYDNVPVAHADPPPSHDAVFFASASAVEVFLAQYGAKALAGRTIFVIGEPTRAALPPRLRPAARLLPLW
jgi:uroporphyrinogen III methyltransferase/synthase